MTDDLSLRDHERAVERSRARLTEDLAVLCSPDTFSNFTDDLKQEAFDARDAFWAELKSRAAANPAAVAAIGAGLAWRFVRRPPIAAGLIGLGLYSLWKTDPTDPQTSDTYRATQFVKDQTSELVATASDMAETVKTTAADAYDAAKEKVATLSGSVGQTVGEARAAMTGGSDIAAAVFDRTQEDMRHRLRDTADAAAGMIRDEGTRNTMLLGVAGVAIAAALGIACQKRISETADSA